ncbi:CbtA family protein [Williamsia sp. MIQD14]|uniref:CbtA family protein n=1 Tax=Williamsia sp. MIQD14 TaxID=3425703 RepID=UPI003DA12CD9
MEKKFIGAGLISGLVAGLFAFVFARIFIEPQVAKAIDYESGRSHAEEMLAGEHGAHEHGEVFTRSVQENIGAGVGSIVFGLAMGAIFAVVFTVLWAYVGRRYPLVDPRLVAGLLTFGGFVAVYLVPFGKYPANPPAVGDDDTIGARSGSYLTMTLVSLAVAIAAVVLAFWLLPRIGGLYALIVSALGYLAAVGVAMAVLPGFDEVPTALRSPDGAIVYPGFPGDVVGTFRFYSLANQMILWTVLGLVFAVVLTRLARRATGAQATRPDTAQVR